MTSAWTVLDPPAATPPPVAVRGLAHLARSEHPAFPESVPYASESIRWLGPDHGCPSPERAGRLVRELVETELPEHPIIVLKGLPLYTRADFGALVKATGLTAHGYEGGLAVRDKSDDGVSVASTEPPEVVISPHNENSYMPNPPSAVMFHCLQAASAGGEVPVNDVRRVPERLPPAFVREVRERGMRYWRRVTRRNERLAIGWEQSFGTADKAAVEAYLERQAVTYWWEEGDVLRFWFERPVFREYRGEEVWFNQLSESNADWWLQHPVFKQMGLTRETAQSDTSYGDGEPFTDETLATVRGTLWQSSELVKLEPTDLLLLDNFLAQHGRMSYRGERRHHVALFV